MTDGDDATIVAEYAWKIAMLDVTGPKTTRAFRLAALLAERSAKLSVRKRNPWGRREQTTASATAALRIERAHLTSRHRAERLLVASGG